MQFNELKTESYYKSKRKGRGNASGAGKTAGRGTKGQNARSGGGVRPGFEGGQNPLFQRIPKMSGFTSHKVRDQVIYTEQLSGLSSSKVDNDILFKAGLIDSVYSSVKVINKGELKSKIDLNVAAASKSAEDMIVKAGGSFNQTKPPMRQKKK